MNAINQQDDPHVPRPGNDELAEGFRAVLCDLSSMSFQDYEQFRKEAEAAQRAYDRGRSAPQQTDALQHQRALRSPLGARLSRRLPAVAAGVALLVLGALGWGVSQVQQPLSPRPAPSSGTSAPAFVPVGYSKVAETPHAATVAAMFAQFYTAINNRDYDTALSFYDPRTSVVDVESSASREMWKQGMYDMHYEGVVVNLDDLTASGPYTYATVSFRSTRSAGYGPVTDPDQSCTNWTVTYQLTHVNGAYRILKAPKGSVSFTGC
jgi:ketosteroid isomerase-like protein